MSTLFHSVHVQKYKGLVKIPVKQSETFLALRPCFRFEERPGEVCIVMRMKFEGFRLVVRFYRASKVTYVFVAFVYITQ